MNGLIIYATCYGSTETYANWIKEAVPFEKKSYKDVTKEDLCNADILVIGSWVLAHKLFLTKWIADNSALLRNKKIFAYSVSGAKPGDSVLDQVFTNSFNQELLENTKVYQCGGKREIKNMSVFHRFMLWVASTFIEKDPIKKKEMKCYVNQVNRKYIEPLIKDLSTTYQ